MKIEHIAMYVNDLERAKDFFTYYFHAEAGEKYHNQTTGFQSYFLSFQGECRLEIMSKPEMEDMEKPLARTGYAHIALSVGTKEMVDSLTEQLRKDGYRIISNPRTTGDGMLCFRQEDALEEKNDFEREPADILAGNNRKGTGKTGIRRYEGAFDGLLCFCGRG